jgi:SAM-dependent methyltransferase
MNIADITELINKFEQSVAQNTFIKLTLSNKRVSSSELKNVYVKPVMIKDRLLMSFVDRFNTKDVTRNLELQDASDEIKRLLEESFLQCYLASTTDDYHLLINKKGNSTLMRKPPASTVAPTLQHDKVKQRIIDSGSNYYLKALGIMNQEGKVKPDMQDKYRQINKYIEIVDGIIKDVNFPNKVHVADMGSGKGYLTFATYEYLTGKFEDIQMTGIELRKELVDSCNLLAKEAEYQGLEFKQGTIETTELDNVDLLIALHACDTATDEAIYRGIKAGARVILCSPCCHKQVRRDMQTDGVLSEITQFGILAERQAEILTDTIRALILEAYGYKTNVAEFVATEHTPKNLIISAVKKNTQGSKPLTIPDPEVVKKINALRAMYSLSNHYLQVLLEKD